ncbi:hypothetical protein [Herbaspirillum sp. ST 5-3]|uniref:hypothetical protein n=1 Tax=Oxalobacteraceae TaxID=75682 RepID=UPI0010A56BB5|nr:hypothetical protein [Herbaspirillum sp. ST 5-3]
MAIDFSQLRWDDIINQARQDWLQQTGTDTGNGGVDQFNGATTNIGGTQAQIMLNDMPYAGNFLGTQGWGAEGRPDYAVQNAEGLYTVPLNSDYAWNNAIFNMPNPGYVAPDGTTDWNFTLGRGEDGGVTATPYKRTNGVPAGMLAVLAAPLMAAYGPSLFGAEAGAGAGAGAAGWTSGFDLPMGADLLGMTGAASPGAIAGLTSGAGGSVGSSAAGAGDFLSSIGIDPASISQFTPATEADFASMGLGDILGNTGMTAAEELAASNIVPAGTPATPASAADVAATYGGVGGGTIPNLGGVASTAGNLLNSRLGAAALGALAGGTSGGASSAGNQTITTQQQIDPRMAQILYGSNGDNGFLSQILGQANRPQSAGIATLGSGVDSYLGSNGLSQMQGSAQAASNLQNSSISNPTMSAASMSAPQAMQAASAQAPSAMQSSVMQTPQAMQASSVGVTPAMQAAALNAPESMRAASANAPRGMSAALSTAAQVNAPGQNNTNLAPAYQDMVYGQAGNNPYLTGAIQKGINQSNNAFGNMLTDATKATQGVLGQIRGGAQLSGQYGGNRQGIAEGQALDSFNTNISRALSQFGQNNTDAAVAAQAGAYDADRNRALNAMQGLGAQQYGVASQNAGFQQQTGLANQGAQNQAAQTNYQGQLQTNLSNAAMAQQANQANLQAQMQAALAQQQAQQQANASNYQGGLQTNLANAGYQQQANAANYQGGLTANQVNATNQQQANATNYQGGLQTNLANAGYQQGANQTNYQGGLQTNQQNAGLQQQANQSNLQSQLSTNQLNSANQIAGIGANSNLLNQAYNMGTNNDAYSLNQLGQVSNMIHPYTGLGASSTQTSPLYQNTTGNILSGATAGLGLWNAVNQSGMLGGGGGFNNWLGNNADVMNTTGLGWSDLASAF